MPDNGEWLHSTGNVYDQTQVVPRYVVGSKVNGNVSPLISEQGQGDTPNVTCTTEGSEGHEQPEIDEPLDDELLQHPHPLSQLPQPHPGGQRFLSQRDNLRCDGVSIELSGVHTTDSQCVVFVDVYAAGFAGVAARLIRKPAAADQITVKKSDPHRREPETTTLRKTPAAADRRPSSQTVRTAAEPEHYPLKYLRNSARQSPTC